MRKIYVKNFQSEILSDEDFGMHKAEGGYSVRVTPLLEGLGDYIEDLPKKAAENVAKRRGCYWLDVFEACEDGVEEALADHKAEINALKKIYEEVIVTVDDVVVSKIKRDYLKAESVWVVEKKVYVRRNFKCS